MISVFEPKLSIKDKSAVLKALYKNNISGTSPIVDDFEKMCALKFDRKFGVAVSNGSVALDLAFQILDLEEGDEVIIPSFTIISCLSAVIRSKGTPVFCDIDQDSWNMTLKNIKGKVTPKTKALLMVHLYGLAAEAEEISKFCDENNITIIEDAAEAHGQEVNGIKCGSFGLISTMSFYANKHITTGEGGMLLTDSEEIYKKAKSMRNLGFNNKKRFQHEDLYWNYRLGGLQAALGISQLGQLKKTIDNKIHQGYLYNDLLVSIEDKVQLPVVESLGVKNHYWVYGLVLKKDGIRDKIFQSLEGKGIQTRPFFWPLHMQKVLDKKFIKNENLPISENIGKNGFYIPIGAHLNSNRQKYISSSLIEVISKNS